RSDHRCRSRRNAPPTRELWSTALRSAQLCITFTPTKCELAFPEEEGSPWNCHPEDLKEMARAKSRESETITFRLPKETKERLIAAGLRYEDVDAPSQLNVSDVIRDVLEQFLDQFEAQQG